VVWESAMGHDRVGGGGVTGVTAPLILWRLLASPTPHPAPTGRCAPPCYRRRWHIATSTHLRHHSVCSFYFRGVWWCRCREITVFCVPVGLCAEVVLEVFEPVFGVIREGVVGGVGGCGVEVLWLVNGGCFGSVWCGGVLRHCLVLGLPVPARGIGVVFWAAGRAFVWAVFL
jgi:hypothetical protein